MSANLPYKSGESAFRLDEHSCQKLFAVLGWQDTQPLITFRHLSDGHLGAFEAPLNISIDAEAAAEHVSVLRGTMTHRALVARVLAHELAHFFHFHYARGLERFLARQYNARYSAGACMRNILHGWALFVACYVFFLHSWLPLNTTGTVMLFGGIPAALFAGMALTLLPRPLEEWNAERLAKCLLVEHRELIFSCICEDEAHSSV